MINQQPNKCYFLQCWHVLFVIRNFRFFRIFHLDLKFVWLWLHFIIWNDIWICFWSKLIYACKTFEMFSLFNLKCWSNELCMRRRRDNQIKSHCKWSNKLLSGKKIIKYIHFLNLQAFIAWVRSQQVQSCLRIVPFC